VAWRNSSGGGGGGQETAALFPSVADGTCTELPACREDSGAGSCICNVTVVDAPVFATVADLQAAIASYSASSSSSELSTSLTAAAAAAVLADSLTVGAFDPTLFPTRAYTACTSVACATLASGANVTVYCAGPACESQGENAGLELDEHVVIGVRGARGATAFYKNVLSMVEVIGSGGGGNGGRAAYAFRNPPVFMSPLEPTVRDAQYETDEVLAYYLNHANTPPFVAHRLIQRFGISNPSPRYVEVRGLALSAGKTGTIETGKRERNKD